MKAYLSKVYDEYKNKYSELSIWLSDNAVNECWGKGSMPAYSIEPYSSELQGNSPGKMLAKKQSNPGNNLQRYFIDSNGHFIGELRYAKFLERKQEWIISRKFYLRDDNQIIGLIFGSALEGKRDATLNHVILVKLEENKVTNSYLYSYDKKFSEKKYHYNNDKICRIEQRMWLDTYIEHVYTIEQTDPLHIVENSQSEITRIYF